MPNQNPTGSASAVLVASVPNTNYTIYETNLLQGFYDADGDTLYVASLSAENGEITDLGNGQWQFVPAQNFFGTITLGYLVSDLKGGDTQGTLSFNINAPQTAPTGNVTISGRNKQNQTLTASNDLKDADGLGTISYQWLRNDDPISGAILSKYTLTQADVEQSVKVRANYIDGAGKAESVSSSEISVLNVNDKPTGAVTISGTAAQGKTLNASHNLQDLDGLGEISYQWFADNKKIGTEKTFTLTKAEVDKSISVSASYVDGYGTTETVSSEKITDIENVNTPVKGNVSIKGKLVKGQTLTAKDTLSDVDGLGDFNYQWLGDNQEIPNATNKTYQLTRTDIGKKMSVKISYVDGGDTPESKTSKVSAVVKTDALINGLTKKGTSNADKLLGDAKNDFLEGLAGNDILKGNAGDDILDGSAGDDSLDGGNGNDELYGGDGKDTLIAGSGNDLISGDAGDDVLTGDAGNDTLDGGLGTDKLTGGDGNDYYIVDNVKDTISETNKNVKTGGVDTVETSLDDYTLAANLENLILSGIKNSNGTGNTLNNQITGNIGDNVLNGMDGNDTLIGHAGNDTLDGGKGMDILKGGSGDDTYLVNNLEDKIIEEINGGQQDQVLSTVDFDLDTAPNVEYLTLSGSKAKNGIGNELANLLEEIEGGKTANYFNGKEGDDTIYGREGNDTLEGGGGNDTLDGGEGSDIAIFSAPFDDYQITRNPDAEGVDQIIVSYVGNDTEITDGTDILDNIEVLQFADGDTHNVRDIVLTGVSSVVA